MELALIQYQRPPVPGEAISPEEFLSQAFATFTEAADSLEMCYRQLQSEVTELRKQLHEKNRDIAASLARNVQMRDFLERIFDTLPCGVLVLTPDYRCQKINPEAQRILGIDAGNVESSQAFFNLISDLDDTNDDAGQIVSLQVANELAHLVVRRSYLAHVNGAEQDCVLLIRDVTVEKRQADERDALKRMQALAEMSAILAHEIRNPLGVLELVTGVLEERVLGDVESSRWIAHIQGGLRMLSATVNNVLQFHSEAHSKREVIEVACIIDRAIEFLRPVLRQQKMHLRFSNHAGAVFVNANPEQLQQVFFNLALNAFRSMQAGGTLDIALLLSGQQTGQAVIQFRDEGKGIPSENLNNIFTPGFTTKPGGPGLGLPVCRRILQQHGGDIRVHSIPGEGTTFSLLLPAVKEARA